MQNLLDCGVFPEFRILLNLLTSVEKVMEKYTFKGNFTVRNYKQNVQTGPKIIQTSLAFLRASSHQAALRSVLVLFAICQKELS